MRTRTDKEEHNHAALPIACTLSDPSLVEERRAALEEIFASVTDSRELEDGYEFTFPGDKVWAERLMRMVAGERECCAFLSFELIFSPAQGPITLRLRGAEGVKEFINEWMREPS